MSAVSQFLEANARYASSFAKGDLAAPPTKRVAIVTCMDARLDPAKFLGLEEGDAHVIRNAGGRVTADVLRSLIISQQFLGTREILVIHHTDCGMLTFTDEQLRQRLREQFGVPADDWAFLPFTDLEQSVRDDIALIRRSPFIVPETTVTGWIYDVRTGKLLPVDQ
ncbi:beta-class carbonic anhydrase [Thermorudis peleae]|uniref:beta-class carbonic anhydrase n=1 Tax=Thermorudis peleae TaxID=1382356 RepID=UPI00056DE8A5|nr:carbonic anhydrase [Thermorudis peleae]